jgi:hypothetical protein
MRIGLKSGEPCFRSSLEPRSLADGVEGTAGLFAVSKVQTNVVWKEVVFVHGEVKENENILHRFNGDFFSVASRGNQRGQKNQYSSGDRPAIALKFLKNNQLFY